MVGLLRGSVVLDGWLNIVFCGDDYFFFLIFSFLFLCVFVGFKVC